LELIPYLPVPKGFTPIVKKKDRKQRRILEEEEIKKLYALKEDALTGKELLAKNLMMLQVTTGMAYCDIVSLHNEHIKYHVNLGERQIRKQRAKSGEVFTVTLSQRATYAYDSLRNAVGGSNTIFDLPTLREINRGYKRLAA
jgi:integrase